MAARWSMEDRARVRDLWVAGLTDFDIAHWLTSPERAIAPGTIKKLRERNGWVDRADARRMNVVESKTEITHEMRVLMDEAFVDAMIEAGYLPSDPQIRQDGRVMWRHTPHNESIGNSVLA